MLDKTILVYYINIGNLDPGDTHSYISNIKEKINENLSIDDKDKLIQYFIPIRSGDSKIECINNPIYILSDSDISSDGSKIVKNIENKLEKMMAQINSNFESRDVLVEKSN